MSFSTSSLSMVPVPVPSERQRGGGDAAEEVPAAAAAEAAAAAQQRAQAPGSKPIQQLPLHSLRRLRSARHLPPLLLRRRSFPRPRSLCLRRGPVGSFFWGGVEVEFFFQFQWHQKHSFITCYLSPPLAFSFLTSLARSSAVSITSAASSAASDRTPPAAAPRRPHRALPAAAAASAEAAAEGGRRGSALLLLLLWLSVMLMGR